ncbi:MAG: hypothetical protein RMA76_18295 [Deltaproteobacteria bacterium]
MTVSAPGKLVLLGDYAVLDGAMAMVGAVNRRAVGDVVEEVVDASPIVRAVLEEGGRDVRGSIKIDTSSFQWNGKKLGIGSSAAVAVTTAALVLDSGAEDVLQLAVSAHRAANGGGSGIDVASSYFGGVIAADRQPGTVQPLPSRLPGLTLSVLFANQSANTSEMVAKAQASSKWSHWMNVLVPLAEQGIDAWSRGEVRRFLSIVDRYGRAMGGLGRDAGTPIVTDEIDAAIRIASQHGGAAKPSGAGGGDVVVVFAEDPDVGARVAEETGMKLVDLEIDPRGLSRRG